MPFNYDAHVSRNQGYVSPQTQSRIRGTRLLIAGCGIGSSPAVCAARMGFESFVLVDGDVVEAHNLNRQFYDFADVGKPKVEALKDKILRINPEARVEAINAFLDEGNTAEIVARADIVFDTVDFLDLQAILRLHSCARRLAKPIFTALSVGFGALVWYFPPDTDWSLPQILAQDVDRASADQPGSPRYADVFASFVGRIAQHLDAEGVEQISRVLSMLRDGKPCPAPQVAVGSFAVGAMAMSMIVDMLAGGSVPSSPAMVVHSFKSHQTKVFSIQ